MASDRHHSTSPAWRCDHNGRIYEGNVKELIPDQQIHVWYLCKYSHGLFRSADDVTNVKQTVRSFVSCCKTSVRCQWMFDGWELLLKVAQQTFKDKEWNQRTSKVAAGRCKSVKARLQFCWRSRRTLPLMQMFHHRHRFSSVTSESCKTSNARQTTAVSRRRPRYQTAAETQMLAAHPYGCWCAATFANGTNKSVSCPTTNPSHDWRRRIWQMT